MTQDMLLGPENIRDLMAPGRWDTLPLLRVTACAKVSEAAGRRARDAGVIAEPYMPHDVIALRVYAFLSTMPWPGEWRPRNVAVEPAQLWFEAAREARKLMIDEVEVTDATVMLATPDSFLILHTPAERAAAARNKRYMLSVSVPIGTWIVKDLPLALLERPKVIRRKRLQPDAPSVGRDSHRAA